MASTKKHSTTEKHKEHKDTTDIKNELVNKDLYMYRPNKMCCCLNRKELLCTVSKYSILNFAATLLA